jgi:hypothetical protein
MILAGTFRFTLQTGPDNWLWLIVALALFSAIEYFARFGSRVLSRIYPPDSACLTFSEKPESQYCTEPEVWASVGIFFSTYRLNPARANSIAISIPCGRFHHRRVPENWIDNLPAKGDS